MAISLDEARERLGDHVLYHPLGAQTEFGTVIRVSDTMVFVWYQGDHNAKATSPADLEWIVHVIDTGQEKS